MRRLTRQPPQKRFGEGWTRGPSTQESETPESYADASPGLPAAAAAGRAEAGSRQCRSRAPAPCVWT
jgi:hypothetical protein